MNIKSASEKTGLTKKAIKYYEQEGLIHPSKNLDNNYREYDDTDILKLNLIGSLRALDIPISEIREAVEGRQSIPSIMGDALKRIEENIENLEKSKLIISSIIGRNPTDYSSICDEVKRLKETLELPKEGKKEYIINTLTRIFPGTFGKLISATYEPFLKVTLDTDEKKRVWLDFIEFLDNMDEFDYGIFASEIKGMDDERIEKIRRDTVERVSKVLSGDESYREEMKKGMMKITELFKANEKFAEAVEDVVKSNKVGLRDVEKYGKKFESYLGALNSDYTKYMKIVRELGDEVKKETGFEIEMPDA